MGLSFSSSHAGSSLPSDPARGRVLALDGLRGVAILLYGCHNLYSGPSRTHFERAICHVLRTGWVGVSLFFVLTGFLTTARLNASRDLDPGFHRYYIRRILRIVPLYYGFLLLWLLLASRGFGYTAPDIAILHASQGWYWAFLANLRLATHRGNFGPEPTIFWSLAVVVHFYLLWPFVVATVRRPQLIRLCVVLVLAAILFRVTLLAEGPDPRITEAIYTLTPARMDDLALGALLALLIGAPEASRQMPRWLWPVAYFLTALLTVVFILARGIRLDDPFFQTIGYTAVSGTAATYIALALWARECAHPRRILESAFLRACGRWSYGIYVWHGAIYYAVSREAWFLHPTALAGSQLLGAVALTLGLLAGGIALGAVSCRLYEEPFQRLGRCIGPPRHPA